MTLEEQNELIESNIPLVYYCIKKYFPNYMFDEDIASCGKLGLVKASRTFDVSKNIKFSTYAIKCITNEIKMYFRSENKHNNEVSLDTIYSTNDFDNEYNLIDIIKTEDNHFYQIENTDLILSFKKILTEKAFNYFILYYIYGLTQVEIANIFNVSRSMICKTLHESRKKIRKYFE